MTIEQEHSMEMMGQPRGFRLNKTLEFSMKPEGSGDESHNLTITVDSMQVHLDTPRGEIEREISEVLGKSFGMVLTSLGEEPSFSGVGEVAYDMLPAGKLNVATDLEAFFPNLADGPLRVGDTWSSTDLITDTVFNSGKKINLQIVYSLAGFETIDGMECAKISAAMNGMLEEGGERMTRTPEMTARFDGTGVWYFAYEEGLLIRNSTTIHGLGEMATGGGQGRPSRMSAEMTIETRMLP